MPSRVTVVVEQDGVVQFVSVLVGEPDALHGSSCAFHARNMLLAAVFLPRKDQTCIGQTSVGVAGVGLRTSPLFCGLALRLSLSARQRTTMLTRHYA